MLTDIFSYRYASKTLWTSFTDKERHLVVQSFNITKELSPYYDSAGKESSTGKAFWKNVHDRLANELGLKSLSQIYYSYKSVWAGKETTQTGSWNMDKVCENWAFETPSNSSIVDSFVKDRLSLVEIVFRLKEEELQKTNAQLPNDIAERKRWSTGRTIPLVDIAKSMTALNKTLNDTFSAKVEELNTRFRQAGCRLHYHNGFIQISGDSLVMRTIEEPFWTLVSGPEWKNVDTDMKDALDQRDSGLGDPAFYAARALESAIKIISDKKGWTHGKENGAQNFIENLAKKTSNFVEPWEADALKYIFSKIRNPFGHGAGSAPMPSLSPQQTDWAIEACMSWVKSLVQRL